jgi:hypothetical protein
VQRVQSPGFFSYPSSSPQVANRAQQRPVSCVPIKSLTDAEVLEPYHRPAEGRRGYTPLPPAVIRHRDLTTFQASKDLPLNATLDNALRVFGLLGTFVAGHLCD